MRRFATSRRRSAVTTLLILSATAAAISIGAWEREGMAVPPLTLRTITIDGRFQDWDPVLANAGQTTHDGDGSSGYLTDAASCALYSTDRDCPLTGGSGNDFLTFSWTYDDANVYLYIERYGSPTNGVDLLFVADVDADKKLTSADRAIHAHWSGTTGAVGLDWSPYVPANAGGDGIVCSPGAPGALCTNAAGVPAAPAGYVDGYTLPGSNPERNACVGCSGVGNITDGDPLKGLQVELAIPWSIFGASAPRPFYWHAVSSNNGSLAQAVDNIGAPDGRLGSFFHRAVTLTPDNEGAVMSPGTVTYEHVLGNPGNATDTFELAATSTAGARLEIVDGGTVLAVDADGNGTWDSTAAGADSNGDGRPDFTVASGATKAFRIRVVMPAGRTGEDVTRITAVSAADDTVSATATDTSVIGSPAILPPFQSKGTVPGQSVPFALRLINSDVFSDVFDLTDDGGCAGYTVALRGDASGAPGALVATDSDGNGTWDSIAAGGDTDGDGLPDFGAIAGNGGTVRLWLEITPSAAQAVGSTCKVVLTARSATTGAIGTASQVVSVGDAVSFTPSYTFAARTQKAVAPGDTVFFAGVIQNNENVARAYDLSTPSLSPSDLVAPRIWTDPNGDGNPSDGALDTTTPVVPPYGGRTHVVVEALASTTGGAALAIGTHLSVLAQATPTSGGAAPATQLDEARVGHLGTYRDALLTDSASAFSPCATVYVHGAALAASDVTQYALVWKDPSGTVRSIRPWPTTSRGTADDAFQLPAEAEPGVWTLELTDANSADGDSSDTLTFDVERAGSFPLLATDRTRYAPGDPLAVSAQVRNEQAAAPLPATVLRYVVQDLAGAEYLDLAGVFQPAPGTTRSIAGPSLPAHGVASDGFAVGSVAYPSPGLYQVSARWQLECGATALLASAAAPFEVKPPTIAITAPTPGALLSTRRPTVSGTATAGASVTVHEGTTSFGPAIAAPDGTFSYTLAAAEELADGPHTFTATQLVNGARSDPSAAVTFSVDATPPEMPAIATPAAGAFLASPNVTVTGSAEASSAVTVTIGAVTGTTIAAGGGGFSVTLAPGEGGHTVSVTARDAADNVSPAATRNFTLDTSAPDAPAIFTPTAGALLATSSVTVTGSAEPGATVTVTVGAVTGTSTAAGDGSYLVELTVPDGALTASVTATDGAGNESLPSTLAFAVDSAAPAAPTFQSPANGAALPPGMVEIRGQAEPGATVTVTLAPANAEAVASLDGAFTVVLPLAEGPHVVVATAADSAGNVSPAAELDVSGSSNDGHRASASGGGGCGCGQAGAAPSLLAMLSLLAFAPRRRRAS